MSSLNLTDVSPGNSATILGFEDPQVELKLLSMGLHPGVVVKVQRATFNHQTYYISARGKNIAVRKYEAQSIFIDSVKE